MPEEIQPNGQSPEPPVEPAAAPVTPPEPPVEEPFDKDRAMATIEKLRAIEKQHRQDKKELERLQAEEKKRADAQLSETDRLQKERDEIAAENAKIKSDLLRREVVEEAGLPVSFASRLQGTTKEELLADAKELAKTLPQLKVAPKVPPTNPSNGQTIETDAQKRDRLFGRQGNPLEIEYVKAKGGGVFGKT